jgi:hypothetical protein
MANKKCSGVDRAAGGEHWSNTGQTLVKHRHPIDKYTSTSRHVPLVDDVLVKH